MLRILLIEDSESDAFIIQRAIRDHVDNAQCQHVSTVGDGEKVLEEQGTKIDVVLLDLNLPDSASPADTYKRIRKWADKIPVIVSTNLKDHRLARSLVHDGAEDYMSKDLMASDPSHVRDAIAFALERHALYKNMAREKERAVKESAEKDTILDCFMGGYSVRK